MKDYKRKDKLLITIIALACLIMVIANPFNFNIRDLAWNYSLMLLLFSAIFWFLSEVSDYISSLAFRYDGYGGNLYSGKSMANLDGLSREQLLALANDCVDDGVGITRLSDEELARLVMTKNEVKLETRKSKFSLLIRIYKTIKFVYLSAIIIAIRLHAFVKDLPKMLKKKKMKSKKKTLKELTVERNKLMEELSK